MSKKWQTRIDETWTVINNIPGIPPLKLTALQTYHNGLTVQQRRTMSEAMAQGGYTHAKPGIFANNATKTRMRADRAQEAAHRAYRRAMIMVLMAKRNSGVVATDLHAALAAVPAVVTGEAEHRVKAELINLNTSVLMMKAGGQVTDINWGGWDGTTQRPLLAGCAIGRRGAQGPGTLGCFVTIGPDVFILSNRHVIRQAGMGAIADAEILQPAHQMGGTYFDVVATFEDELATHDAAIAKVSSGITCTNTTVGGTVIQGSAAAINGGAVTKHGCATRQRRGTISNLNSPDVDAAGTMLTDQLLIDIDAGLDPSPAEKLQVKGDSGSVALDHNNMVVALVHGQAGATQAQATHIAPILAHFGAAVLVGTMVAP